MRWTLMVAIVGGTTWDFEKDEAGKPPAGFEFARTGEGGEGIWVVQKDGDARVLAQTDSDDKDYRFPLAVVKDSSHKNLSLSVRIKPVSGKNDQAGGLVFRYQDKDNYYVARSNVLEKNVRLYRVVKGNRTRFAGKEGVKLTLGEWHTLKVECKGGSIKVFLNGEELFAENDKTFTDAGKVGVWTKSDSVTCFDDLTVEELK